MRSFCVAASLALALALPGCGGAPQSEPEQLPLAAPVDPACGWAEGATAVGPYFVQAGSRISFMVLSNGNGPDFSRRLRAEFRGENQGDLLFPLWTSSGGRYQLTGEVLIPASATGVYGLWLRPCSTALCDDPAIFRASKNAFLITP